MQWEEEGTLEKVENQNSALEIICRISHFFLLR